MRIKQILGDDFAGKEDFKYLTQQTARRMLQKFILNEEILEELLLKVEPESITGFQLKDILLKNYSLLDISDAIEDRV